MKKAFLLAAAAALVSTGALAQASSGPPVAGGTNVPNYQQGSGQSSGGPARELNSPTGAPMMAPGATVVTPGATVVTPGMEVRSTGTVRGEMDSSNTRQAPQTQGGGAPSFQQGSGQQSGGYAKELNTQTGIPTRP